MIVYLNACNTNHRRNAYKGNALLPLLSSLVTRKVFAIIIALILLQNKALGLWNSFMQKSGFPKMRHYVGFSQIGSHMNKCFIESLAKQYTYIGFNYCM